MQLIVLTWKPQQTAGGDRAIKLDDTWLLEVWISKSSIWCELNDLHLLATFDQHDSHQCYNRKIEKVSGEARAYAASLAEYLGTTVQESYLVEKEVKVTKWEIKN